MGSIFTQEDISGLPHDAVLSNAAEQPGMIAALDRFGPRRPT